MLREHFENLRWFSAWMAPEATLVLPSVRESWARPSLQNVFNRNQELFTFLKSNPQPSRLFIPALSLEQVLSTREKWKDVKSCELIFFLKEKPQPSESIDLNQIFIVDSEDERGTVVSSAKTSSRFFIPDLSFSMTNFSRLEPNNFNKQQTSLWPYNIPNPDGDRGTCFASFYEVLWSAQARAKNPKLSLVIPHFENEKNLLQALESLSQEMRSEMDWSEVILVDDGSTEFNFLRYKERFPEINILRLPRWKQRSRGDVAYRAGSARNAGAHFAKGENIIFMDCDILISKSTIKNLLKELEAFDVVMPVREQLQTGYQKTISQISRADVGEQHNSFWNDFYQNPATWDEQENKWNTFSSYCFAIKRDIFSQLRGFSSSFVAYGCEDTHLGFVASQSNKKFKLLREPVFHIQPEEKSAEHRFDSRTRRRLLFQAYYFFFQITQSAEIFEKLIAPHQKEAETYFLDEAKRV